jgi:hypothetical protein
MAYFALSRLILLYSTLRCAKPYVIETVDKEIPKTYKEK